MTERIRHTDRTISRMTAEERWAATEYMVEATDLERFSIWETWHKRCELWNTGSGFLFTIGHLTVKTDEDLTEGGETRYPVTVCVLFLPVDGHVVAFYEAASLVVHHDMVRKLVTNQCPPGTRHTNASNFHLAIHDLGVKVSS